MLCGGIIAIIFDNNGDIKTSLYKSRFLVISVALAGISYKITLDILKKLDIAKNTYNNQMITFTDLPSRIFMAIETGFKHLFAYKEPFMSISMNICFVLFIVILLVLLVNIKFKKSTKIIIMILFAITVVTSQAHILLAKNISNGIVTEYYGLLFLRVLIVVLVFKCIVQFIRTQVILQSIVFVLSCVFIWICVVQDLEAQKVHKFAMERDFRYINRVIDRIEQSEGFNYNKQYCGVVFGEVDNTTKDFISNMFPMWYMESMFKYIMPKDIFAKCEILSDSYDYHTQTKTYKDLIVRLYKAGVLDKLEPWPHKNSIIVFENIIAFMASRVNLDKIREMAQSMQ